MLPDGCPVASSLTPAQPRPPHLHQGPSASAKGWRACRDGGRHPIRRLPRRAGAAFTAIGQEIESPCFSKKPQGLHDSPVHLSAQEQVTTSSDAAGPAAPESFSKEIFIYGEIGYDTYKSLCSVLTLGDFDSLEGKDSHHTIQLNHERIYLQDSMKYILCIIATLVLMWPVTGKDSGLRARNAKSTVVVERHWRQYLPDDICDYIWRLVRDRMVVMRLKNP
ncbi:hypothetical protein NDU88_004052 [Pleurodeles waltl]|uniref:Uncharacterized protein n=1 Tax=Pleurodeles waltl TaxID=8319 RepID=A0AAV7UFS5_PLEWA|nr:hypothetical protein NDU88_004052 [Pleurodeles waltl]